MGSNDYLYKGTPEKAAYLLTGSRKKAKELLKLADDVKEIGLTDYKEIIIL